MRSDIPDDTLMGWALNKSKKSGPEKELLRYKAVMCPNCGTIQTTAGEIMFRCRRCDKTSKFRIDGDWHVKLKDFDTPHLAMMYAKDWACREFKTNSKNLRLNFGEISKCTR
jgi:uncharacterized C2H2 Zn-finger protein